MLRVIGRGRGSQRGNRGRGHSAHIRRGIYRIGNNVLAASHLSSAGESRNPNSISFSLTNNPPSARNGPFQGGGAFVPYRSEPIHAQPYLRLRDGAPAGWRDNHFLEFAPNIKQLVAREESIGRKPMTKEQMLTDFWDDLGLSSYEPPQPKLTKENIVPRSWEVRERLRDLVCGHEEKIERTIDNSKYPVLIRGEVDSALRTKTARNRKRKKVIEDKDKKYVEKAKERLKTLKQNEADALEASHKAIQEMYESTRRKFHKSAAPTRFFAK